jgi:cell division protein FtsZ
MSGAGSALMGIGSSRGDDRAVAAAEMAISSPLLEASIDGAHGVLLSIQGGSDLGLFEINEAAQLVANSAAVDANIIFGAVIDDALGDEVRVTVIAAGFDEARPGRGGAVTVVPASPGRSMTVESAVGVADANRGPASGNASNGNAANGNATNGGSAPASGPGAEARTSAAAAWAGNSPPAAGDNGKAAEPPASAPSSSSAPGGAVSGSGYPEGAPDTQAAAREAQAARQPGHAGTADPIAEVPVQPASDVSSGYVPAPVSFVSDEDGEYGAKPGYGAYEQDHGGDAAQGGTPPGWRDSGRAGKQDKVFDVPAGRRRPVVFEEEDDLDVPDFLK